MAATDTLPLLLLLLGVLVQLMAPALAQAQPPMARPGCRDRCGNITIPYPFGMGAGCFHDDGLVIGGYELACEGGGLTVLGYGHRLADLSLSAGEARAYLS